MTIAVFIDEPSDTESLVGWGARFAADGEAKLLVVFGKRATGNPKLEPVDNPTEIDLGQLIDPSRVEFLELSADDPPRAFEDELESLNVELLILPAHSPTRSGNDDQSWQQRIYAQAACECMLVQGAPPESEPIRILIATGNENDPDTIAAIERVGSLAISDESDAAVMQRVSITLLFIRPDDDLVAGQVAQLHLNRLAAMAPTEGMEVQRKYALADRFTDGIKQQDLNNFDLVLVGTRKRRLLVQLFRQGNLAEQSKTSVAVIRRAVPVRNRLWARFRSSVRGLVPQIDREERISVVDRLQNNSVFNFDFLALMFLSTLIAALGLVRNSSSIVIGAMLVAPLMTPLVAIGFSLVQGNEQLIRRALKSVLLGFTLALSIGAIVGLILHLTVPTLEITNEMRGRDTPNLLDLIVALASGVAGAYAMGRSHLVSAIPGVAIAAALVPPIATSGLTLAMGDWLHSAGALMLFATNIVAIVLGTAVAFWAIGINSREHHVQKNDSHRPPLLWPRFVFWGLVVLSFVLAAEMSLYNPMGK